jgi:hypothetical protein
MGSIACQANIVKYFLSSTQKGSKIRSNCLELDTYAAYRLEVAIIRVTNITMITTTTPLLGVEVREVHP